MSIELPRLFSLDIENIGGVFPPTRGKNIPFFIVNHIADVEMIRAHAKQVEQFTCEKIVFGGKCAEKWKEEFTATFKESGADNQKPLEAYCDMSELTTCVIDWFKNNEGVEGCLIYDDRQAYEDVIEVIVKHVNF